MDFLTVITIVGGIILTVGYIPQLIKLFKTEETAGINNGFWYLITTAVTITAINLIIDSAPIVLIIIQIVNATLAGLVLLTVHFYRKEYTLMNLPVVLVLSAIVIAGIILPLEVTQSIASLAIVTAYLIQLVTLFKAPSVAGVAPSLYLLIAVGLGVMATKMFVTEVSAYIITTEIVNIILLLLCASASLFYQHKSVKEVV